MYQCNATQKTMKCPYTVRSTTLSFKLPSHSSLLMFKKLMITKWLVQIRIDLAQGPLEATETCCNWKRAIIQPYNILNAILESLYIWVHICKQGNKHQMNYYYFLLVKCAIWKERESRLLVWLFRKAEYHYGLSNTLFPDQHKVHVQTRMIAGVQLLSVKSLRSNWKTNCIIIKRNAWLINWPSGSQGGKNYIFIYLNVIWPVDPCDPWVLATYK